MAYRVPYSSRTLLGFNFWEVSPLDVDSEAPPGYMRHNPLQAGYWRKAWVLRCDLIDRGRAMKGRLRFFNQWSQAGPAAQFGSFHDLALVDAAMPPIARGPLRAREIWIDDALCRAARGRRVALWQRRVAAIVIVAPPGPDMQANRVSRIVRLGARRPY